MKQVFLFIVLVAAVVGCDIVPYDEAVEQTNIIRDTSKIINDSSTVVSEDSLFPTGKSVLLEDFTGHTCSNCPAATETATGLQSIYGSDKLIIMAWHTSYFADPNPAFPADYTTSTGNTFNQIYDLGNKGLPRGMVNRDKFGNDSILAPTSWGAAADAQIQLEQIIELRIARATYFESSSSFSIELEYAPIIGLDKDYTLQVFLLEDGLISPQIKKKTGGGTEIVQDYVHNYVVREKIYPTDNQLDIVLTDADAPLIKKSKNLTLNYNTAWKVQDFSNTSIVAAILDPEQNDVIQAAAKEVILN